MHRHIRVCIHSSFSTVEMYTLQVFCIVFIILFSIKQCTAPSPSLTKHRRIQSASFPIENAGERPISTVISTDSSPTHSFSSIASEAKAGPSREKTIDRRQLIEEQERLTNIASSINLDAALESTYGEQLNPARDGFYARIQRILIQQGAAAVVGSVAGYGVYEFLNRANGTTTTTAQSNQTLVAGMTTSTTITQPSKNGIEETVGK